MMPELRHDRDTAEIQQLRQKGSTMGMVTKVWLMSNVTVFMFGLAAGAMVFYQAVQINNLSLVVVALDILADTFRAIILIGVVRVVVDIILLYQRVRVLPSS